MPDPVRTDLPGPRRPGDAGGMPETTLAAGLRIRGLAKSYGPVTAVAGIDLDIVAGETVALLGPNGAGKSTTIDMLLGLTRPDAGEVAVFGRAPGEAVRAGLVGAMLQSGGLISEVSVRELILLAASLYPEADAGRRGAGAGRPDRAGRPAHHQAVRRPDPAGPLRARAGARPRAAGAGRADRGDGRGEPAPVLGLDAAADRGRADRPVRHPLPRGGRPVRRSGRPAGRRPGRRRRAGHRDQGRGRRPHHPGHAARRAEAALAALPGVGAVERHGDAVRLACTDSDLALRALLAAEPTARDIEVGGADLEDAFVALTSPTASAAAASTAGVRA